MAAIKSMVVLTAVVCKHCTCGITALVYASNITLLEAMKQVFLD